MRLSKTSEYALRILSFMAKDPDKMYSAKYLVQKLNISDKYLRRLMTDLSKNGFIHSVQGRGGGYLFNKDTNSIFLSEIIDAVEGMGKYMECILGFHICSDENPCVMHTTWLGVRQKFLAVFEKTTLADLNFDHITKF